MSTPAPLPDRTTAAPATEPVVAAVPARPRSRLWLWIVALVLLQATAWTTWLIIASKHHVAEVPLTSAAGSKP